MIYTLGIGDGPGGRDRKLARKSASVKKCLDIYFKEYLLNIYKIDDGWMLGAREKHLLPCKRLALKSKSIL